MTERARTNRRGRRTATALALTLLAAAVFAPCAVADKTVRTTVGATPEAPALVIKDGAIHLTLDDAVEIALRRNLDLSLQRYSHTQTLLGVDESKGIFDTLATLDVNIAQATSPQATQLAGALVSQTDNRNFTLGVQQLTRYGGVGSFGITGSRSSTNSSFFFLNPNFQAAAQLQFSQPLLKGFGTLPTERSILQAKIAGNADLQVFEEVVTGTLQSVENAYWALVDARDQLNVAQESLALAKELDQRNQVQVDVGTLAPIELVQSEATVATREEGIVSAQAAVGDAADRLLQLLNLEQSQYWSLELVPETKPETDRLTIDLDQAIKTALDQRPEIQSQALTVESTDIDVKYFHNQKKPRVDLNLTYNAQGQAGRGVETNPDTGEETFINTDLSNAFGDVAGRNFDGWQIGISASYPIQNRQAKAQSTIADLAAESARTKLDQLKLQVVTEVRTAARGVNTAAEQITSARSSVHLQEKNLEAEQKRYENGMSTSFQVTQIQDDLTAARSRLVTATTNYRTALVAYYKAIGTLLDETGVELVKP
jgi:outer membrane protein